MLNLIDEHTRESLRCVRSGDGAAEVIEALADVMVMKGVPKHIRSDNGAEFVPKDSRKSLADTGAEHALYISNPVLRGKTGYCESLNSKLRDEFLKGEIFYSLKECRSWMNAEVFTTTPSGRTLLLQHSHNLLHRKTLLLHAKSPFRFCRRPTFRLAQKYRSPSGRPRDGGLQIDR